MAPSSPGAAHDSATLADVTAPVARSATAEGAVPSNVAALGTFDIADSFGTSSDVLIAK